MSKTSTGETPAHSASCTNDKRPSCGRPIVALSSSNEERDLIESYRHGVNSYIVKPMDFDQFAETVRVISQYWLQFNKTPKP